MASFLRPVEDDVGLKTSGIPWGKVYIGQAEHSVDTRIKEHHRHIIHLYHPKKSAVAERSQHELEKGFSPSRSWRFLI
jgi:hypothetical protein